MPADLPIELLVQGFSKTYGDFVAVRNISFEVRGGDVVALVGPNGAGKTTTLRAISGILSPSAGKIEIGGVPLTLNPVEAKMRMAYVPDDPKLFDAMTVWEHLAFIAAAYGVDDWKPRAEQLLELFELGPKKNALTMELSRGMRQKVAISCAYLHEPRLILLDEPMTGLDPPGIRTMKQSIRQCAERGQAVVLSSHLLSLVEDLCTRVIVMTKGTLRFDGTIGEARAKYATGSGEASLEEVFFSVTADAPASADAHEGPA
ncbi:MAG TPA: ABC transporter ATP-binding protein [Phycisphaerales bacterium]|nr:ABC transporter ATP-binding protein [Phycisphaerales bacterium]